jgi:hypothetical protein
MIIWFWENIHSFAHVRGVDSWLIVFFIFILLLLSLISWICRFIVFRIIVIGRPSFVFLSNNDLDVGLAFTDSWRLVKSDIVFFHENVTDIPSTLVCIEASKDLQIAEVVIKTHGFSRNK